MMQTNARLDDLRQRLVALRARFDTVGERAAAAAPGVTATIAPDEALVDDLRSTTADFDGLRYAIVDQLQGLPNTPDPSTLGSLKALDAVLTAMERVHAERARRAAWEAARDEAVAMLERVLALVHREDRESTVLAECQAHARELHGALLEAPSGDVAQLDAHVRPFVQLMRLVDGWDRLGDEECVALQDTIERNFGRPVGLAALRGKLGHEYDSVVPPDVPEADSMAATLEPATVSEDDAVPEPEPAVAAAEEPLSAAAPDPVSYADEPPVQAPAPAQRAARARRAPAPPAPAPPPAPAAPPAARRPPRRAAAAPTPEPVTAEATDTEELTRGQRRAPPGSSLVTQIRLSGQHIEIETPEQQREREELLQRLAEETAQWWLGARAGWESLVQRGLRPPDAARDVLTRFPYLLSVPLSRCDEFEDGRLAQGYGLLLQRLEKEEPGFVRDALTRLNPQLAGRAQDASYPLGQELYQYVVAEGRLYKTFPELLKDVLTSVLPEPGLWLQGAITETNDGTTIVTRSEEPGSREEDSRTLTSTSERFRAHVFSVTTGPLTARVFSIQASELAVPVELEIRLAENGTPKDQAWIVVSPLNGKPEQPRKQRLGGTKLEGLGREHGAVWVAVFNSDPSAEKSYELTVTLTRKLMKAQPTFAGKTAAASPFKRKG